MEEKIQNAIHEGTMEIGGFPLKIAVLEDGSRIIEKESFHAFLRHLEDNNVVITEDDGKKLGRFLHGLPTTP